MMRLLIARLWMAWVWMAAGCALATGAAAQTVRGENIESELVAATDAIVPGQALTVALRLAHDPHWHTYWQVPGDSGLPTQIAWKLPPGWSAGPIQWPVPKRLPVGPLMNFGYEGDVLLLSQLNPPADLKPGTEVQLTARADWLICKDICIPGGADLKLRLPVKTEAAPARRAAQIAAARGLVPQIRPLQDVRAVIDEDRIQITFQAAPPPSSLELFPLEEGRIVPAAPQLLRADGNQVAVDLTAARPVAPGFKTLKAVLVANGGPARADAGGWAGVIEIPLAAGTVASRAGPLSAAAGLTGQAAATGNAGGQNVGLVAALIGAFIGGLILNLMPCVFPVLALKLLSLMQHSRGDDAAGVEHAPLHAHGWLYSVGVILSFVALAGVLIALRMTGEQLGWGFQLQTPWVVAALLSLFFLIGLNLLGAFEFTFGGRMASSETAQRLQSDNLSGSFWTGVLAVVVAAPCTAPFMGAALGYAATQPALIALAVFAVLGAGMAMPYLLLTLFPTLLAKLPRPGVWMERFKQALAFPMFATAVWLIWVLAQQVDINAIALALLALVLLGLAGWAFGLAQRGNGGYRWFALGAAVIAVYVMASATLQNADAATATSSGPAAGAKSARGANGGASAWRPWSQAALQEQIAAGKPVMLDFTAAWCVTCQANKKLVLQKPNIEHAFAQAGVVLMRADWTRRDPAITQALASFNRNGVPLYVLYDRQGKAQVLPELLTEQTVLDALAKL